MGLVEKLVHYRAKTSAAGRLGDGHDLLPVTFRSEYSSRKKDRRSIVKFDPQSGDVVSLEITKRGKPDDSDVPEELRKNVIDPLTAFFRLRDFAATARKGDDLHGTDLRWPPALRHRGEARRARSRSGSPGASSA